MAESISRGNGNGVLETREEDGTADEEGPHGGDQDQDRTTDPSQCPRPPTALRPGARQRPLRIDRIQGTAAGGAGAPQCEQTIVISPSPVAPAVGSSAMIHPKFNRSLMTIVWSLELQTQA